MSRSVQSDTDRIVDAVDGAARALEHWADEIKTTRQTVLTFCGFYECTPPGTLDQYIRMIAEALERR